MNHMPDRFERHVARTDPWLFVLAVIFLVAWSARIVFQDDFSDAVMTALLLVLIAVWVIFAVEIITRAVLSRRPGLYFLRHPIDLLVVLVPPAQPLKLLTVFASAPALATRRGRGRGTLAVFVALLLIMWAGASAVFSAERNAPGATIETFGQALWWAPVTMFTVGYGDEVPVTTAGRLVAVVLMVTGVALIGVVTASVASWFIAANRMTRELATPPGEIELRDRLAQLEAKIDVLLAQSGGEGAAPPNTVQAPPTTVPAPPDDAGGPTA